MPVRRVGVDVEGHEKEEETPREGASPREVFFLLVKAARPVNQWLWS